jgi:hypothetical protein
MNPIDPIEHLAGRARDDMPPLIDVAPQVMLAIGLKSKEQRLSNAVLYTFSTLSALAATVIMLIGFLIDITRIVQ